MAVGGVVAVEVGVAVGLCVGVNVYVGVGGKVAVAEGVSVGVAVLVGVGVRVGVGDTSVAVGGIGVTEGSAFPQPAIKVKTIIALVIAAQRLNIMFSLSWLDENTRTSG